MTDIYWGHDALTVVVALPDDGPPSLKRIVDHRVEDPPADPAAEALPLVEIFSVNEGRARSSQSYTVSSIGARLRTTGYAADSVDGWETLTIHASDEASGIAVRTTMRSRPGIAAAQIYSEISLAPGSQPCLLQAVTSLVMGGLLSQVPGKGQADQLSDLDLIDGRSDWLAEGRWTRRPVRHVLPRLDLRLHGPNSRGRYALTSRGTWSTGDVLPTGVLIDRRSGAALAWQVEANGPWHTELGERSDGVFLALLGPADTEHQWQHRLTPETPFRTTTASVAVNGSGGLEAAIGTLTAHRRALRPPHPQDELLPVVYNDFMNTLRGDPTTDRVLSLARAAAAAGAEIYCIDAGWYDDVSDWWDGVGAWRPAVNRFPGGFGALIDQIRKLGLLPGVWVEPEAVGVMSPVASSLPSEAFLQRDGIQVREHNRYHLDFSHPAARAHLDEVIDRLVADFGIGYLKLDYNINPGAGTDAGRGLPAGVGLLAHQRAYSSWLAGVHSRHPELILENCSSGAMRMDQVSLSAHQLQSSSDQENPLLYPPIAASAPMMMPLEQIANWAYPQPDMSPEQIAFTLVTGLAGRMYLSGFLDRMSHEQISLVHAAVTVHKSIRGGLRSAMPFWPLGLPRWDAEWIVLGLMLPTDDAYLAVWHRPDLGHGHGEIDLDLPGRYCSTVLFPPPAQAAGVTASFDAGRLRLLGRPIPSAAFLQLAAAKF